MAGSAQGTKFSGGLGGLVLRCISLELASVTAAPLLPSGSIVDHFGCSLPAWHRVGHGLAAVPMGTL